MRGIRRSVARRFVGCLNESPKERKLFGMASEHTLRMPVNGKEKPSGALNPFNNAVRRYSVDREARRQITDDLVVGTGHAQFPYAKNISQA